MIKKIFRYGVYLFAIIGFSLVSMFFAVKLGLTNEKGIIDTQRTTFTDTKKNSKFTTSPTPIKKEVLSPSWAKTEEWKILREAISKDRTPLYKASALLDIDARVLVSILVVEQMRLYSDNREVFKSVFAPLKILGTQSQFSWGVLGIKQETAKEIEKYLGDSTSPFYPGKQYEHLLDFTTDDHDKERFERIVNEDDRYYSYLYGAILVKELEAQWKEEGSPISKKPGIVATLFNIGFSHSKPNKDPKTGGAPIPIGDTTYSFGALAEEFYYGDELIDIFPKQ